MPPKSFLPLLILDPFPPPLPGTFVPSVMLFPFSKAISLQHLNMCKYLPLKNNLKTCHNNVLFSGNLLKKYSLNSYLNPFSIISRFTLVWFWSETAFTKVSVVS